ncbi:MAG: hypothetical protein KBS40_06385 [Bacteroidales bacterium]|nr:hypothetical protein [Bacteroidales bacterium]
MLTFTDELFEQFARQHASELLKRKGYPPRKLHSGKRGYVVKVTENLTDKQYQEIHELFSAAGAASTF